MVDLVNPDRFEKKRDCGVSAEDLENCGRFLEKRGQVEKIVVGFEEIVVGGEKIVVDLEKLWSVSENCGRFRKIVVGLQNCGRFKRKRGRGLIVIPFAKRCYTSEFLWSVSRKLWSMLWELRFNRKNCGRFWGVVGLVTIPWEL